MEREVNEVFIHITGKAPMLKALEMGKDYELSGTATVYLEERRDNQDQTVDLVYKAKYISEVKAEEVKT